MTQLQKSNFPWTRYLDKSYDDPHAAENEVIALRIEHLIGELMVDIKHSHPDYNTQIAKEAAINLVMKQMLAIQYENAPEYQKVMTISLFTDLPELRKFKQELAEKIRHSNQKEEDELSLIEHLKAIGAKLKNVIF